MIEKSLAPAKIRDIEIFPDVRVANVILTEDQIPLAVGRGGINIRLASQLTEYDIKIIKEGGEDIEIHEFESEIGPEILEILLEKDIKTARDFLEASPDLLLNDCSIDFYTIFEIRRVMLLEFDEPENEKYISTLKTLSGITDDEDINTIHEITPPENVNLTLNSTEDLVTTDSSTEPYSDTNSITNSTDNPLSDKTTD